VAKPKGSWQKGLGLGGLAMIGLAVAGWYSLDKETRAVVVAMPTNADVLFWSIDQRDAGFQALDRFPWLAQARTISAGDKVRPLPTGAPLEIDLDMDAYMAGQRSSAIVVLLDGDLVFERYGLDFEAGGRWTSFSVAKSLTSTLVGAAIKDGVINSLDDKVTRYIPDLSGSAYDDVSIRQLLTMSSGVRWNEDYTDPASDVARFNAHVPEKGLDATVSYMRSLEREAPPGERWVYKTGETNLVGVLVSQATGRPLAEYLSEKVWAPFGMEQDATWLLGTTGHEISGCCIQATTRDMARFGQFILEGGVIDGAEVLPDWWLQEATSTHYQTNRARRSYGYQWWTYDDGSFAAGGIFGQGIFIDPARNLVIASNANWALATDDDGAGKERDLFYDAVQAAVDARNTAGVHPQD
jgi:CubicO group peptidase (beta-lactamase class C family)